MIAEPTPAPVTLLVSSCDAYADLWPPFFTILARRWPGLPWPVALATETLDYTPPPAIAPPAGFAVLHPQDTAANWTHRLTSALRQIRSPCVLLMLDDFFLTGSVNGARVEQCRAWMEADPAAACFSFYPTSGNGPSPYPGFEKRPQTGLYRFNAQIGLWRRERLIEFLAAEDQDAWAWENEGNTRSFALADTFYSEAEPAPGGKSRTFPYDYMRHGLIGGKWFPDTPALFKEYDITDVNFSARGFYSPEDWPFLPSVASAFVLDSVLYPDVGTGYSEATAIPAAEATRQGPFAQRYALPPGAAGRLRWDPATRKGFALEGLRLTFTLAGGEEVQPAPATLAGNYTQVGGKLLFLQDDPQLTLPLPAGALALTISGTAACPVERADYAAALAARARPRGLLARAAARLKKR